MCWRCAEGERDLPRKRPKSERAVGRPYIGRAFYERVHWVDWVEERAEEHRQAGSRKPYIEAHIDLLEMEKEPKVFDAILGDDKWFASLAKSFKKKRLKARQEWRMVKKANVMYRGWLRFRSQRREARNYQKGNSLAAGR
jgi:hypothetical protein